MELRRVAPVLGLAALLAADVVLIGWAFRPVPSDDYVSASTPAASTSPKARPTAKASPSSTPQKVNPVPIEQFVSALGPRIAWVVRAGTCDDPGTMWVTKDEGASWTSNGLPARILRLLPASGTEAVAPGGDDKCALKLWKTTNSGGAWGVPQDAGAAWSRLPDDPKAVHTASDEVVRPCGPRDVIDLKALGADRAQVLCANGVVYGTSDGGARWTKSFTVKSALAMTVAEGGSGVVVKADPSCAGVVAVPVSSGEPADEGECVKTPTAESQISVSVGADSWWLVVGKRVFIAEEPVGPWTRTESDLPD